jgi:hypothetical protein
MRFNSSAGLQVSYGCIAQKAEHASHMREVEGSIPSAARKFQISDCGVAQLDSEHSSCKRADTSSTLVAAANFLWCSQAGKASDC